MNRKKRGKRPRPLTVRLKVVVKLKMVVRGLLEWLFEG